MRKNLITVIVTVMLVALTACGEQTVSNNEVSNFTSTVAPTESVPAEPTVTLTPTEVQKPLVTSIPTPKPTATFTQTPEPIATSMPTPEPDVTATSTPLLTSEPVKESTEVTDVSAGFEFESNGDGTCTLVNLGKCDDEDIVIPEKSPTGDLITKIAEDAFYSADGINSISFCNVTIEIEEKAFQFCEVEKLIINNCNLLIGEGAFYYCDNIAEALISDSKIEISSDAFYSGCNKANVKFNNCTGRIDDEAFQFAEIEKLTFNNCELELGKKAFYYCSEIEAISVMGGTLTIESDAFYSAGDKPVVNFSDCKLVIDDESFQFCNLISLTITNCQTEIGKKAFYYCGELEEVLVGLGNITIGNNAFYSCSSLNNVSIAAESETDECEICIDDEAFAFSAVENVVIGKGKVSVGDKAFYYCSDLGNVEFKGTTVEIDEDAFYGCPDALIVTYGMGGSSVDKKSEEESSASEKENSGESVPSTSIRPEFKEAMDSYEEFFKEYVNFMKKYAAASNPLSMLDDYYDYMLQYTETMTKLAELEQDEMSTEEALYYAEVSLRISQELLEVAE